MKTLKEFIVEYNTVNKYGLGNDNLFETFEECFDVVAEQGRDEHRWYFNLELVTKVEIDGVDRFFAWTQCEPKGDDGDREDCGWETPDLDDLQEVFPHEVMTTIYKYTRYKMEIQQVRIPDDMELTRTYTIVDLGDGAMAYHGGYTKHLKGKFKEKVDELVGNELDYLASFEGVTTTWHEAVILDIVEVTREELRDKGCKFIIQSDGFKVLVD